MTRLNITLPDEIAKKLENKRNKSRFIAVALEEKLQREERETLNRLLLEGYRATSGEDVKVQADWEKAGIEEWD